MAILKAGLGMRYRATDLLARRDGCRALACRPTDLQSAWELPSVLHVASATARDLRQSSVGGRSDTVGQRLIGKWLGRMQPSVADGQPVGAGEKASAAVLAWRMRPCVSVMTVAEGHASMESARSRIWPALSGQKSLSADCLL